MRHMGPRVLVKTDEQSSVGRGGVLYGAHFRPEIALIVWAATRAPHQFDEIHITEGFRDIRDGRDLHEECRALDLVAYRFGKKLGKAEHELIARSMRAELGPDYDVVVHDAGSGIHIHTELDPK